MKKQSSDPVPEAEFYFPEGIWWEILSWLEVKYLLRCKSVCKSWYVIINSKQFAGVHAIHDGRRNFHSFSFEDCDIKSFDSTYGNRERTRLLDLRCEGFILIEYISLDAYDRFSSATYWVWNPSTKLIFYLPPHGPLPRRVCYTTLFHNSSTNSYYVLSDEYIGEENKKHNFKLLDLGGQSNDPCRDANLSWKTVHVSEYEKLSTQQRYKFSWVQTKGILYILFLLKVGLSSPKIICFDLVKQQTSTTLDVPDQSLRFKSRKVRIQVWRGKPVVSFVLEGKLNAWVLEDYKEQKWADTIQIPLPFSKEYPSWNKVIPFIFSCADDADGEVLLQYSTKLTRWEYDPKTKQLCKDKDLSEYKVPATLVSVKGMQPDEQLEKKEHRTKLSGSIPGLDGRVIELILIVLGFIVLTLLFSHLFLLFV